MNVEGSDLPVAAHVVDEFHQAMEPKHAGDHQHKDDKRVVSNAAGTIDKRYKSFFTAFSTTKIVF